jgi:DnaD/phage-associated family protein
MRPWEGFPAGKVRFTRIPAQFFTELLPAIDNIDELKIVVYALWKLERMEGDNRYLMPQDFYDDQVFVNGMAGNVVAVADGLQRAVLRGILLEAHLELKGERNYFYFLNSARGRAAIKAIKAGQWKPSGDPRRPIELAQERSNIFSLYEEHIGPITPMIADALRDAEIDYPPQWLEDAMRIAVENNARAWSYVQAILRSWQEKGRDERRTQGDTEKDRRKYTSGEFSDFIEH